MTSCLKGCLLQLRKAFRRWQLIHRSKKPLDLNRCICFFGLQNMTHEFLVEAISEYGQRDVRYSRTAPSSRGTKNQLELSGLFDSVIKLKLRKLISIRGEVVNLSDCYSFCRFKAEEADLDEGAYAPTYLYNPLKAFPSYSPFSARAHSSIFVLHGWNGGWQYV